MSLQQVAGAMQELHGPVFAQRWLERQHAAAHPSPTSARLHTGAPESLQEALQEHSSHRRATELLEPHREALGPAYATVRLLARWSIEHAHTEDPAPHLLTTYWTLEEATGKTERTLIRHLVEDGHPWSAAVRHLIDVRPCYGEMLRGDHSEPCIVGTVIRFFPKGRLTANARVKRWGERDLIAEADAGRTRPTRMSVRERFQRRSGRTSAYTALQDQAQAFNWLMVHVDSPVVHANADQEDSGSLYSDIPKKHVLNALRADLNLSTEAAEQRGASVKRARARWVELAGRILAHRFGDDRPPRAYVSTVPEGRLPHSGDVVGYTEHKGRFYPVHYDGFTNLWRRALWTAIRAELYGRTHEGWRLLERLVNHAHEAQEARKARPTAWAWTVCKREGFAELLRDYWTGAVG